MLKRGFTLIELMVSVAIFSTVMMVALGALLAMSEADRKAQTLKSVINNLNFALESMSRTIRTGYDYHCGSPSGQDCTSGSPSLYFTNSSNQAVVYWFNNDVAQASICNQATVGCIERSVAGSPWAPLTAPEVIVTNAKFYVTGSLRTDTIQPRVTLLIQGYVEFKAGQRTSFNIETTATQRVYDQ